MKQLDFQPSWLTFTPLDEADSTNSVIRGMDLNTEMRVVSADYQTAGRGQRGNTWESERGMNLSFSILLHPEQVAANRQFILSQAISLAIQESLEPYGSPIRVKWPNDIYWNDRKICGILIENELNGKYIERCIIGIGLNVNQAAFQSDAPNPISLKQITGKDTSREELLQEILTRFHARLEQIKRGETDEIVSLYKKVLYRNDGFYPYKDANGTFEATIEEVEPQGFLILKDRNGKMRRYAFKEVSVILGNYCL